MSGASLADPAIQAFLARREIVTLAMLQPDGSPVAMAMWHLPEPDALVMISVDGLAKVRNLRRDPRVSVVAEAGTRGDVRGVALQGRVEFLSEGPERRAFAERFLTRYEPDLARLWGGRAMPANRVMFRVVPRTVRSWGLGSA